MATNQPAFLDASVILEAVLQDRRHAHAARNYIANHTCFLSPLSAHLFIYFGQKDGLPLTLLTKLLSSYAFTDFGAAEITWATKNHQDNDFEDALQVACAVLAGHHTLATFDQELAQNYQRYINIDLLTLENTHLKAKT